MRFDLSKDTLSFLSLLLSVSNDPRFRAAFSPFRTIPGFERSPGTLSIHAFCREVLPPLSAPRPAPFSAPPSSRRLQKGKEEGAFPPPSAVSHRAPANRERTRHPPLPLFTSVESGARFEREMFARAFWAGDVCAGVLGGRCPLTHWLLLLPLRSFHPSRGDRDRTVFVEWRVVKMVVAQLWKVASWREWSDCWRRDCWLWRCSLLFCAPK